MAKIISASLENLVPPKAGARHELFLNKPATGAFSWKAYRGTAFSITTLTTSHYSYTVCADTNHNNKSATPSITTLNAYAECRGVADMDFFWPKSVLAISKFGQKFGPRNHISSKKVRAT